MWCFAISHVPHCAMCRTAPCHVLHPIVCHMSLRAASHRVPHPIVYHIPSCATSHRVPRPIVCHIPCHATPCARPGPRPCCAMCHGEDTGIQPLSAHRHQDTGTQGHWDTRTPGHRDTRTPGYQDTGPTGRGQCFISCVITQTRALPFSQYQNIVKSINKPSSHSELIQNKIYHKNRYLYIKNTSLNISSHRWDTLN